MEATGLPYVQRAVLKVQGLSLEQVEYIVERASRTALFILASDPPASEASRGIISGMVFVSTEARIERSLVPIGVAAIEASNPAPAKVSAGVPRRHYRYMGQAAGLNPTAMASFIP
ncbi:hypothetical protein ARGLB_035_00400 [Arthrobacter globiformis NBRC 12137]|uniref:Uncharacterized protein n=1 Tax=Arthrobacter globiformis (strain ATCC 8010 / DSM 20124 / JCM 1332 / NBRC 12137 / NCIMB 8907 / NRRL B-2979 / 168) TaxID=1077972 RepID=H0QJS4_ARTG1|nr:hypothetical protein ARGLB_035_00400 [Arthrobacter globiformis NBRC 12137]